MTMPFFHLVLLSLLSFLASSQPSSVVRKEALNGTQALTASTPESHAMVLHTYVGACLLTITLICILYWRKGLSVVLKVLAYLFALATMKAAVKVVESNNSFHFPLFLTGVHFGFCATLALAIMYYRHLARGAQFVVPAFRSFMMMFVPISLCFGGSVAMNNIALVAASTSFVEIVSAASPIVTVVVMLLMGKPFNLALMLPCFLVFLGCALCSKSDPTYTILGLSLAAGANVPRALKSILQQVLMQQGEQGTTFSPLEVLAWTCVPSCLIMLGGSLVNEGLAPYIALHSISDRTQAWQLLGAIFVSCINAAILNSANLFVVKDLGAVGSQIVAQTKALLVVLGGVGVLGENIPRMEFAGFALVMIGVFMYNDLEARSKPKEKILEKASNEEKQPLLKPDAQRT